MFLIMKSEDDSLLSGSASRIQSALDALGVTLEVVELPVSTRTARDAAEAVGCEVAQIAKSIVFRGRESDRPVLIITSGANRVDEEKVRSYVGEALTKADADFVRQETGFAIGGVPPIGHLQSVLTFVDQDLLDYPEIWAAAGTPRAVFRLTPKLLLDITSAEVIDVT